MNASMEKRAEVFSKVVKVLDSAENGTKVEIFEQNNGLYGVDFYEYYTYCGWRLLSTEINYDKDCVEWEFDVVL